ncbi:sensor histidine kinase N-terminal domain-containing protein [Roseateles sp.]|uniref:sensor histidine kinase n=1 Tax=Roseateles sp. TaxID=1971397 RepID=UPI0032673353
MNLAGLHRSSVRHTLLLVLLTGMLCAVGAQLVLTWRTAVEAANAAYDRSLLGAIKSIDANISSASGGIGVELPYRMLEFFELTASGQVDYRVATEDGLVEIGSPDLPKPAEPLTTGQPQFMDAAYFGEPVRVGSYARLLDPPLPGGAADQRIVIQVAEKLSSRQSFTRSLVLQAVARDLLLVAAAGLLLAGGVAWALRPLARLRDEVRSRRPDDMTPIAGLAIPADVQPLVEAINFHVARNRSMSEARRRFIDDASHQLRTPLTTLATQVGFALRVQDPALMGEALRAIKSQLDETVRQTNQMLALARTDAADVASECVDAAALAEGLTRDWWATAREAGVDLGIDAADAPLWVQVHPGLLQEALSNLLHNAIRYTGRGGHVTVRLQQIGGQAAIAVCDDGPGIPADELHRASERFFRGSNVQLPGSGLGLAIARSIATRHGGDLQLAAGPGGRGLVVTVLLPLDPGPPPPPASR